MRSQPSLQSNFEISFFHSSWGESAGAMSVGYHLVIDDGDSKGLFHGGFMVRLQISADKIKKAELFPSFFYRNPVLLHPWWTLQLNNLCSIKLWPTLDALDLLT
jgi:hypothetical protein